MNKIIPLSFITIASLFAAEHELAPINVEATLITEVSQNAQVSADLAQALSEKVPSIDMNRRSGIANDIYIRGQKRDNISIEVDGTKVCGACPNRMDPPVSHILANQIESVEVTEGPYDVETFGVMSGGVKITTKKPTKDLHGEFNLGYGMWNYTKVGATVSGGNDLIRVLVSASTESSDQYKDGNGDTLAQQVANNPSAGTATYQTKYEDMQAYKKNSVMAKIFVDVAEDQELQLSATQNRSDDVLYPSSKMDAAYDYSNIYSVAYDVKNLSDIYKDLNLKYYYSDVDHPMDTRLRNSGTMMYMTNQLQTTMQGLKLKNSFEVGTFDILVGLDGSKRTWVGEKFMTTTMSGAEGMHSVSLTDTLTQNQALFAKVKKELGDFKIELGARYDSTDITPTDASMKTNSYNGLNANILTSYKLSGSNKIFLGFGQASRVPDARELYMPTTANQNLKQTTNQEVDLGYELQNDFMKFKVKTFYSMLKDYIYLQKGSTFQNVDATVYGAELTASYFATDEMSIDMSASYKKGQKANALVGQTDKDLADMAPLRGNVAFNYEYQNDSLLTVESQLSDKWSDIDTDNGEQTLGAWGVVNFKLKHALHKNVHFTLGVNNLFDETYAKSNTYVDLTLISAGADTMLLNEPGRYIYTNFTVKF